MKNKILFFISASFLLFICPFVFAAEVPLDSKIVKVTVYPDSALLTRQGSVQANPGTYQFVFEGIIPDIDESSIRVKGEGSARARIFGAQHKKEYLTEKPAQEVQKLEKEIEGLINEKRGLVDSHNIVMQEREWLYSLKLFSQQQLPRDLITKMPATKDLGDLLKFLDDNLKVNYASSYDIEFKIKELDKKIEAKRREWADIGTPDKIKRSIVVDAEVLKAGSLDIMVSYRVYGATWQSMYDARVSFEKSQTELVSHGVVRQTTGEDWNDVEIVLSSAKPSIGGRMPEAIPWFLGFHKPRPKFRQGYAAKSGMMAEPLQMAGAAARDSLYEEKEVVPSAPAEIAYAVAEEKGISVTYKIPRKATIKSDGSDVRLPVSSQDLAAKFKYYANPAASDFAYLASQVINDKELQLPAGRVSVFLGEDFVGTSSIDNIGPAETFDLFLGVDENVKVKREQLEKKTDDVIIGNIPSPNRKITLRYKITVENYKNKKIGFELFEAVPVSQDERIKVKIEQVSFEPKDKEYKDRPGVWRWEFELEPKGKKEIFYTVIIEYPRNMQVEGL
ncbi:MAG TPA: hypothetical protein DCL35_08100 [Candidatus Omnitrophica bacterium]|nr:hypothetical protein [Candidatus Omnitrophota bacterium]